MKPSRQMEIHLERFRTSKYDLPDYLAALTNPDQESYEIGSEKNSAQQNIWLPEDVLPGFRSFMTEFYWKLDTPARRILEAISLALGLTEAEENYLLDLHSGHNNQLRLLHYPPIQTEKLREHVVARMPAHCDWRYVYSSRNPTCYHFTLDVADTQDSTFTMLFQDDCGGLDFEHPDHAGLFIPATPIPGALALNVGDMLQRFSNGAFLDPL